MALTPASLGFGSRTGTAGVVTLGFGTGGTPPPSTLVATVITLGFGQRTGAGGTATLGYGTGGSVSVATIAGGDGEDAEEEYFAKLSKQAASRYKKPAVMAPKTAVIEPVAQVTQAKTPETKTPLMTINAANVGLRHSQQDAQVDELALVAAAVLEALRRGK